LPEWPQYQDLMIQEFPAAYVIPGDAPLQLSPHQPARLVDFLLVNDVEVEQASQSFTLDGVEYPKGTYIVWMDQPKRGLANAILDDGLDLSDIEGLYFYSPPSVWSYPRLWGVSLAVMEEKLEIKTHAVTKADRPQGSAEGGKAGAYAYLPTSVAAIKATNDLLQRGVTLYRAEAPFADSGREFGAGVFILPADEANTTSVANELANQYALDVLALSDTPDGAIPMRQQRIAVELDSGGRFLLKELGFDFDEVSWSDLNAGGISAYDVFINDWWWWSDFDPAGQASFEAFFEAGGDYVGLGTDGARFADEGELLDFDYDTYYWYNAIVHVDYDPNDPVAAGFRADGYAFMNWPVVYTVNGGGVEISARLDAGDDFLVAGFWPGWQTSGANGMATIVHGISGMGDVTLIGIDPTFRAHPEHTFRIVANAIYTGLE
jgi:hypothetical protein